MSPAELWFCSHVYPPPRSCLYSVGIPCPRLVSRVSQELCTQRGPQVLGQRETLPYRGTPTNKCRGNGIRKSLFGNHLCNNYFRQELSTDAKTSGWKCDEEHCIYIVSKDLPTNYFLIIMGKRVTLQWRNLVDTALTKWTALTLTIWGQTGISCLLMWCTDKDTTSLMWCFCQKFVTWI